MKDQTKSSRLMAIPSIYDMQTTFFKNVLDGISDKDSHSRLDTKANHIAWLAGALVQQRFDLAELLDGSGKTYKQQADDLFRDNQGIRDGVTYPSLDQYRRDWDEISPALRDLILKTGDSKLDESLQMGDQSFPVFEMVTFTIYREANMIGQIALWRRLLGYEAMKYM